jgi:hypothetical protein
MTGIIYLCRLLAQIVFGSEGTGLLGDGACALGLGGWVKANNNAFLIRNFSRSSSSPSQFW